MLRLLELVRWVLISLVNALFRSPWRLEELADLPDDVDRTILHQAGLAADGSAAWAERTTSPREHAVIVRHIVGRTVSRVAMQQLNGKPVDLRVGNMNDSHTIAGTAISDDHVSRWAILIHDDGGQVWLNPTDAAVQYSASSINNQGFIVGNTVHQDAAPMACSWQDESATPVNMTGPPVHGLVAAGSSPNLANAAGAYLKIDSDPTQRPWQRLADGTNPLNYVDLIARGAAHDVNDDETSCGEGHELDTDALVAWRFWRQGSVTNRLSSVVLSGVTMDAVARSLNRYGEAVGSSGDRAVYWPSWHYSSGLRRTTPVDLTAQFGDPNLVLADALRINGNVDILCFGWRVRPDGSRAYKMFLVRNVGPKFRFGR